MRTLTNQLDVVSHLSGQEIEKIVASQFGTKKRRSDAAKFDRDSAVFDSITRKVSMSNGREIYLYEVDLVDENGNHRMQVESFEKPDLDYERSMATLALVKSNPQLKKIYDAMAQMLAERSSGSETNDSEHTGHPAARQDTTSPRAKP